MVFANVVTAHPQTREHRQNQDYLEEKEHAATSQFEPLSMAVDWDCQRRRVAVGARESQLDPLVPERVKAH
jgi:hypothetical protein